MNCHVFIVIKYPHLYTTKSHFSDVKMEAGYQAEHLHFVSGHNGSDPWSLAVVGGPVHCSQLVLVAGAQLGLDYSSWAGLVAEWAVLVLPTLLALTILHEHAATLGLASLALAATALLAAHWARRHARPAHSWSGGARSAFVTNHRALMIVFTTVGILAVDFPAFPRKFAKTETFGYGWMDLGVGSFTFVNGLVSSEARRVASSWRGAVSGCLPLVALGLARLASVTVTGYHSHVTEYGTHWNFFFSLAAVRLLSSGLLAAVGPASTKTLWVASMAVAVIYEGFLTFGLADWVLASDEVAPRTDLVSANREGLCSSLGYLALYLAGVSWGREVFELNRSVSELVVMLRLLVLWSAVMWGSLGYSLTFFLPPSRRLANYTFFTWIVAYNLTVLTAFLLTDLLIIHLQSKAKTKAGKIKAKNLKTEPEKTSESSQMYRCPNFVKAVDYNPLLFFLLANLGTGLVNMTVETIHTEDTAAVLILLLYQASLALVATILYRFKIKLKFW